MPSKNITFVHAPVIQYDQNYGTLFSPLWAYTLASHLPENWKPVIVDSIVEGLDNIESADVFAFSGINQDLDSIQAAHKYLRDKYPYATFIVGGPITWSFEQEERLHLLDNFDYIFILDGEHTLPQFLHEFEAGKISMADENHVIRAGRFPLDKSLPVRFDLYREKIGNYYGAVVEVSRGCPFLCEFCDIRVLPGNNKANNKEIDLIVQEMDEYYKLGVTQFQFACDNFIGDIAWARECVDAILAWKQRTGARISIFTWLTINLHKLPDLMEKMRLAGFSILFIGVESVNQNSLLETAKVQNSKALDTALVEIQSHGFIIAPGFIFGFDSDNETIFDDTLEFIRNVGLIGGDPSFLMALPGTPLFQRMKRTGRLVTADENVTVRRKIETNIRYLQSSDFLANGFMNFIRTYTSGPYQFDRFRKHIASIVESNNFTANDSIGYGSPREYLKMQLADPENRKMMLLRILYLLHKPQNFIAAVRGWWLLKKTAKSHPGMDIHFNYWVYVWTNIGLKYWGIKETDFQLHQVGADFDMETLLSGQDSPAAKADATKGETKVEQQSRYTRKALEKLIESNSSAEDKRTSTLTN